jgi:hypothetical protein
MTNQAKLDAAADSMKAELNKFRREQESFGLVLLCANCDNEAAPGSCYCDSCEQSYFDCDN